MSVLSFIAGLSTGSLCIYGIRDALKNRRSDQGDRLETILLGERVAKAVS
jgi:hypothetical protein